MNEAQTAVSSVISFSAAFTAGVLGSAHCFAMCGGLSGALGMRARALGVTPKQAFGYALLAQLGRIGGYMIIGALLGGAGAALADAMSLVHAAKVVRIVAGALLLAIALRIALRVNLFAWLERLGAQAWTRVLSPMLAAGQTRTANHAVAQSLLVGAVWGWLPCGLVYSIALYAAMSGDAAQGASIMLAFGLGTLPSMLSSAVLASQLSRLLNHSSMRWVAAAVLAAFGVWTMLAAFEHGGHH